MRKMKGQGRKLRKVFLQQCPSKLTLPSCSVTPFPRIKPTGFNCLMYLTRDFNQSLLLKPLPTRGSGDERRGGTQGAGLCDTGAPEWTEIKPAVGQGLRSVLNIRDRKGSPPHSVALGFLLVLQAPNQFFIHDALLVQRSRKPLSLALNTVDTSCPSAAVDGRRFPQRRRPPLRTSSLLRCISEHSRCLPAMAPKRLLGQIHRAEIEAACCRQVGTHFLLLISHPQEV